MGGEELIVLEHVGKRFDHGRHREQSLRSWFVGISTRQPAKSADAEYAITDVSFSIRQAEAVALIGDNGAGKSTLLRLMAKIYEPSTGIIDLRGRLASVLELGAGFHKELSGADNLAMYAAALGMNRSEFEMRVADMIAFADIGDVLHKPIKQYSTGMQARLALAVALCGAFDVILLDEALSVGDRSFREKAEERVLRYIADGGSIVLASHNLDFLERVCSRALWIAGGRVEADGTVESVVSRYRQEKR